MSDLLLSGFPGRPFLTLLCGYYARLLLGKNGRLSLRQNEYVHGLDTEAYFVYLGEYNIGRYVVRRDSGYVERRFFCIVPDDFPVQDFPIHHLGFNTCTTTFGDALTFARDVLLSFLWMVEEGLIRLSQYLGMLPMEVNKKVNRAISAGLLDADSLKIINRLLIPGFRPGRAGVSEFYGAKVYRVGLPPTYLDRQGRLRVNFAVAAHAQLEVQAIVWCAEKVGYWAGKPVQGSALVKVFYYLGSSVVLSLYAVRMMLPWVLLSMPSPGLRLLGYVDIAYFLGWRLWAKRRMLRLFEGMGGNIEEERRKLALEKAFGMIKPKPEKAEPSEPEE